MREFIFCSIYGIALAHQSRTNMEGLVAEPLNSSITDNMSRRGLNIRQRREINVPKVLGEDATPECRTAGTSSTTPSSTSTGSKFQPKIYIPERLRAAEKSKETQQQVPSGSSLFSEQYAKSFQDSGSYSSRVLHGHEAQNVQPDQSSTVLATSRGLFQLRPRRNIRVKSFDELESDLESSRKEKREEPRESSYTTGFLKDQAVTKDRLARRGRHSISDMLGGSSMLSTAPSYDPGVISGYNPDVPQPYLASDMQPLHSQQLNTYSDFAGDVTMPGDSFLQDPQENLQQPPTEPRDVIAGINRMTENLNNLDLTVSDHQQQAPSNQSHPVGIHDGEEYVTGAMTRERQSLDDVIVSQPVTHQHNAGIENTAIRLNGFQTEGHASGDVFNSRLQPSVVVGEREETIDEKKERILRNLHQQKMAAMAVSRPADPNFETLEEKKARIFAKLREKHGINIQTEMLGQPLLPTHGVTPILLPNVTPSPLGAPAGLSGVTHGYSGLTHGYPGVTSSYLPQNVPSYQSGPCLALESAPQDVITEQSIGVTDTRDMFSNGDGIHTYQVQGQSETGNENIISRSETSSEKFGFSEVLGEVQKQSGDVMSYDNSYAQRTSPCEDICSVDSGFHGGDPGREDSPGASLTPPAVQKTAAPELQTTEKTESQQTSDRSREHHSEVQKDSVPVKVMYSEVKRSEEVKGQEEVHEESNEETLIKPSAVKASGNLLLKKTAPHPPPTKPKPSKIADTKTAANRPPSGPSNKTHQSRSQNVVKPQPPRPKSAPPNKSKSIANLSEVLPSPRSGRRASTSSRDDVSEGASPFSRNSRLRSSTKAWEIRQAEKQAEIRSRMASSSTKPAAPRPQTPKKSVITGQVSLSPERSAESAADRPKHTPRSSSNYDKPWRTGSVLASKAAGTFLIRSAQPEKSVIPERPKKPLSNPSSRCSSRAQSPCGRPRNSTKLVPVSSSENSKQKSK